MRVFLLDIFTRRAKLELAKRIAKFPKRARFGCQANPENECTIKIVVLTIDSSAMQPFQRDAFSSAMGFAATVNPADHGS